MDITFTLQSTTDGSLMTGQAANTTVYLSIDGAAFSASTNAAAEIGRGLYKVTLTSAESEFSTLYYQPVCTGAQTNLWSIGAPVTMPTVPTASDNATAVWDAQTKVVTIDSTQAETLATASALSTVSDNVSAVKAKTDNLPADPAAVGSAMTLTQAYDAAKTASQFDPSTTAVVINAEQAATMVTATGFATPSDVASAVSTLSGLLNQVLSGMYNWNVEGDTLTIYDSNDQPVGLYTLTKDATGNIIAVAPAQEEA